MNLHSRPFDSEADLAAIRRLLVAGRQAANGTYYIHAGDFAWWYSYFTPDMDPRQFTTVWESAEIPGELAGWALYSPAWFALDVFVHPLLHGSPEAAAMWTEAEERSTGQYAQAGRKKLSTLWISERDDWTTAHLLSRGFMRTGEYTDILVRSLAEPVVSPDLPEGYRIHPALDENDAALRAAPQHAAFGSELPLDVYFARYARFMRSPGYPDGLDCLLVSPDGRGAAFCIVWPDEVNRVGLFEPVGVHPDFQRKGLGRAVVSEGLLRLKARGMETAMVCGLSDLPGARAFYTSLGFQPAVRLNTYGKELGEERQSAQASC